MEASRLTFRKETLEKMSKKLSPRERGRLAYDRLVEAAENGQLAKCKRRGEVANIVGYTKEQRAAGYAWVSQYIRRGHLSEVMIAPGEYQYFLGNKKPVFSYKGHKKTAEIEQETKPVSNVVVEEKATADNTGGNKITITIGDNLTVTIDSIDTELVKAIVLETLRAGVGKDEDENEN